MNLQAAGNGALKTSLSTASLSIITKRYYVKFKDIQLAIIAALLSQSILASDIYTEISIGQSSFPVTELGDLDASVDAEKESFSFSIGAGYSFNNYISLEVSYSDLGKYSQNIQLNFAPYSDGPGSFLKYDLTSFSFAVIPSYPLTEKWIVFAKIGNQWWDVDGTNKSVSYINGLFDSFEISKLSISGSDSLLAIGVRYRISQSLGCKFTSSQYDMVDDKVDNFSFSFSYTF